MKIILFCFTGQNWFDSQQTETCKFEETEEEEIQCVPSSEFPDGTICELCHDKFDLFYNHEKDEWQLKDCLVAEGLPYHPFCYKDYRVSSIYISVLHTMLHSHRSSNASSEMKTFHLIIQWLIKITCYFCKQVSVESNEGLEEAANDHENTVESPTEEQEKSLDDVKKEPEEENVQESLVKEEVKQEEGVESNSSNGENSVPSGEEGAILPTIKQEMTDDPSENSAGKG